MADNKDFLSQFSEKDKPRKPESFKEEVRIPVSKPKKEVKPIFFIIPVIILLIVGAVLFYVFGLPHIPVEDFIGKTQSDVAKWATQNEIDKTGIIFNEEYSLDFDNGQIISQTPNSGKVKKNAKMTFVISKGADPDVEIKLPDLEYMTKSEIEKWIKDNHLLSTKITTAYDETVEEGNVIKVDYSNIDKDHFTRGTTLRITVSKGPKPAEQVTVKDFTKKYFSEFETWAKENKIEVVKNEVYSDTVESGLVVSQSQTSGKIEQGKTITVSVSKGKGVKVPNFLAMTETEFNTWKEDNGAFLKTPIYTYADSNNYIIKQDVKAGTFIGSDTQIKLTINKGNGFYLKDISELNDTSYDRVKDWADNKAEELGLSIDTHRNLVDSDLPAGTIIRVNKITSGTTTYSEVQKLPLEVDITYDVSAGPSSVTPVKPEETTVGNYVGKNISEAITLANNDGLVLNVIKIINSTAKDMVVKQETAAGEDAYKGDVITIIVSNGPDYYLDDILSETGFEIIGTSKSRVIDWSKTVKEKYGISFSTNVVVFESGVDSNLPIKDYKVKQNGIEVGRLEKLDATKTLEIYVIKTE